MSDINPSPLPEVLRAALSALSEWLRDQSTPNTIIGGVAVSLLAQPRATKDIDAVVWIEPDGWAGFLTSGEKIGFLPRISGALDFARRSRVLLLQHQASKRC